ncbi:MAG: class I SAM-dependent methyltransferase [Ignavibacteria bacterium]|nr:class I SAM-dependent methyltransferase [Ignavibacteria bacterium]
MKTIEECVVTAMDGSDKELFPYLPYILQDVWEMGAEPETITELVRKHISDYANVHVLDLACGKGAVSVRLSKTLGCKCYGIDAIPEFIDYAQRKAVEFNVERLCAFETGDIREKVKELFDFDVIILGAIGPVFGDYFATLSTLSKCINENGIFIIDDGYIIEQSNFSHPLILKQEIIIQQIDLAGMKLIEDCVLPKDNVKNASNYIFGNLQLRCGELMEMYPEKRKLFQDYLKKQEEENDVLENKVVCSTMVIKRKQ